MTQRRGVRDAGSGAQASCRSYRRSRSSSQRWRTPRRYGPYRTTAPGGDLFLHRVDVLAAALPGGLSAYLAGGGSTHDYLLRCYAANSSADPRHGVASFRPPQAGCAVAWGQSVDRMLEFVDHFALGFDKEFYCLRLRRGVVFEAEFLGLNPPPSPAWPRPSHRATRAASGCRPTAW